MQTSTPMLYYLVAATATILSSIIKLVSKTFTLETLSDLISLICQWPLRKPKVIS